MPNLKSLQGKLNKIKDIRLNQNIITYLICVAIASVLWFLNTLNQEYSTELTYPLKYQNLPQNLYPVSPLPKQLQLEVKAQGFALLGHRIKTSFLPISLNFETYTPMLREKNGEWDYILKTDDIKEKIGNQINKGIQVSRIHPEIIHFRFAAAQHKKVAVHPEIEYNLKRQYIIRDIQPQPDSIQVCGPTNILDTLQYIRTDKWTLKNMDQETQKTLELICPENCQIDKETTIVTVQVEQCTEDKKTVNIYPIHVPDSLNLRLFPSSVNISYEVGLSRFEKVTEDSFVFAVEYPQDADKQFLQVKAIKIPPHIKNLQFTPQKVEFIIEKK